MPMNLTHGAVTRSNGKIRMSFEIEFDEACRPGDLLDAESHLQRLLNDTAVSVVGEMLSCYDTHGEPLQHHRQNWTSKGKSPQIYQCYGGPVTVERHVYQSSAGGAIWCPMEDRARLIAGSTPHFASIVTGKYSAQSGRATQTDLKRSHQRDLSVDFIQTLSGEVGKTVAARERYPAYQIETPPEAVQAVIMAADSTCVPVVGEDYKHVAVASFRLIGTDGVCLEKIHLVNAPEDKKITFWQRVEREVQQLKQHCGPDVPWFGLSDGAPELQEKLETFCDVVTLDFYHVSEYVSEAADGLPVTPEAREKWMAKVLHGLKHDEDGATRLLAELQRQLKKALNGEARRALEKAIGYVERNLERMQYVAVERENMPIGSGMIEAACKYVVKQRAAISGARWKRRALQTVLSLRALYLSANRFEQFWRECARTGY
jgi:hypothetical protein